MPLLAALLLVVFPMYAQSRAKSPESKSAVPGNFGAIDGRALVWKAPHIHTMPHSCTNEPDRVYGRLNGVYYACIKGKEVCSDEKGAIPGNLIANFDAAMREHNAKMKEYRGELVRQGRAVSEDPSVNHMAAIARHEERLAEAKQTMANRRAVASPAQVIAVGPSAAPLRPPPAPI